MICYFNINDTYKDNETRHFFSSLGAESWFGDDRSNWSREVNIEFIKTPEILAFLSKLGTLGICSLNQFGITFYVTPDSFQGVDEENPKLHWEIKESFDGIIFCPMSNIKSIDTVGKVVANKNV